MAILLVVFYHVDLRGVAPGGYVGVDVFFVISGFLITRQLFRELDASGRISFLGFYARRARRILPAAMLTVMVTTVASALLLNPLAGQRAVNDGLSAIYFGANFHFAAVGANYFNASLPPSPVQHFWSLSVEEQFYVAWPLLLMLSSLVWLAARRRRTVMAARRRRTAGNGIRGPSLGIVLPATTFNSRDVGGRPAGAGIIHSGMLFRSDAPAHLDERGVSALRALGARTAIDLREPVERELDPINADGLELVVRDTPILGEDFDVANGDGRVRKPVMPSVILVLAAIAAVSLFFSIHQTSTNPSLAYYSILTRAWELAVGAIVALALPLTHRLDRRAALPLSWIGLVCIGIAAWAFSDSTAYPGDAALLPVLGAAAVIVGGSAATSQRRGAQALLGTPPFQRVGSWSYSWYLWHWPVLILAPAVIGHALSGAEAVAAAAVSLVIAIISFALVERPILRMQVLVRRPALGLSCAGVLAAIAVGVVALSSSLVGPLVGNAPAAPSRALTTAHRPTAHSKSVTAAQLTRDLIAGANIMKAPSNLTPPLSRAANALPLIVKNGCSLQHPGVRSKPCIYGDTTSSTSVVLFGDSHAAAWFSALDEIANQQHWRLVDITKAGCPPVEVRILYAGSSYANCTAWRRNAEQQIAALHPALVVVVWARFLEYHEALPLTGVPTGYGSIWQDGVAAIFSFLHRSASHVVFISDGPTLNQLTPDCVSGHLTDVRACTTPRDIATRLPTVKAEELQLAKREHITAIDPTSWFCGPKICPVIVGNILLYRDNAHMTPAWSKFISPVLSNSLIPVLQSKPAGAASG